MKIEEKISKFQALLNAEVLDFTRFRKYCLEVGIPEDPKLRAVCWKLLLNYLSVNKSERDVTVARFRTNYKDLVEEFLLNIDKRNNLNDHPLNLDPNSSWNQQFQYYKVYDIIHADCLRMRQDFSFFRADTNHSMWQNFDIKKQFEHYKDPENYIIGTVEDYKYLYPSSEVVTSDIHLKPLFINYNFKEERHIDALERILYIYAKTNTRVKYVQGMHDLVGTIYFVFNSDKSNQRHTEADTFFCFTNLMSEIQDSFIKTFDRGISAGVGKSMHVFTSILKHIDPPIYNILIRQNINPLYFAFKWIVLLFSSDFHYSELIPLWDLFFADPKRFKLVKYCGVAILILIRNRIIGKDFEEILDILTHYQDYNITLEQITNTARYLYLKYN